jgi:hypothetical protein
MNIPHYIRDIQSFTNEIPYGELQVNIKRVNKKTVSVTTQSKETLRYTSTEEAFNDLSDILSTLVETGYTGKATVQLDYKDGEVRFIGIHNEKEKKY